VTLSETEAHLLHEIARKLGWSKSKVLQVAFYEWCQKYGLIHSVLQGKTLGQIMVNLHREANPRIRAEV
jgi:hypothetical protein